MLGYRENFLDGIVLPLPSFSIDLSQDVLTRGKIFDYPNYSVVMNGNPEKRSPVIVCLNIDQSKFKQTRRSDRWRIDPRIGFDHQLDNAYYANNPWDRGHMARRTSASQGRTVAEAQHAADETFYFSNSCLQHANLNQDEWLGLEDWVYALDLDLDGKISVFSGPFYGDNDRTIRPSGRRTALIPAGFFKVVCFINKDSRALDVRAFVMYQDEKALRDKDGRSRYNNQSYQVTISEVEALTGLRFDHTIYQANPLYYSTEHALDEENVVLVPERIEVARPQDIVAQGQRRQTVQDDIVDIYVAAAMVNPDGRDAGHEWISLINLGSIAIDLTGWTLKDKAGGTSTLDALPTPVLQPGQSVVVRDLGTVKLGNAGDVIKLFDADGNRIDWVNYTPAMVRSGQPVLFLTPRDTLEV